MKKLLFLLMLAAAVAGCKKDEEAELNIVRLPFGCMVRETGRATVEDVQAALATGADSVFLESQEDWYRATMGNTLAAGLQDAKELTSLSPRVRGKKRINPNEDVAKDLTESDPNIGEEYAKLGFIYAPGYRRE
jgi:hypothetical protein